MRAGDAAAFGSAGVPGVTAPGGSSSARSAGEGREGPPEGGRLPLRWRVVGFLTAGSVLNFADRSALSAVFPALRAKFGLSGGELGLLLSLFLWCYAAASPFAGNFADRHSRSRTVLGSIGFWSLFMALTAAAGGLAMLFFLSVALGFAESFYIPAAYGLLADHHGGKTRGRAMSLLSVGSQGGVIFGGACAGFLAERYGWRAGFLVLGAIGLGLALISRWFLADAPKPAGAVEANPARAGLVESFRYLIRVRSYLLLLAKQILAESVTWTFFGWLPLYVFDTYHLKLGPAALAGTTMLQVTIIIGFGSGGWFSDWIARRGPDRRMLAIALPFLCAAPFPLVFLGHPTLAVVSLAMAACSFFRGLGGAGERPTVSEIVPARFRATAFGVMNTCATASGAFGVLVAGLFKRHYGLSTIFSFATILFLLTGVALCLAYRFFMPQDIERFRQFEQAPGTT